MINICQGTQHVSVIVVALSFIFDRYITTYSIQHTSKYQRRVQRTRVHTIPTVHAELVEYKTYMLLTT